jgi:hypothetical protein
MSTQYAVWTNYAEWIVAASAEVEKAKAAKRHDEIYSLGWNLVYSLARKESRPAVGSDQV